MKTRPEENGSLTKKARTTDRPSCVCMSSHLTRLLAIRKTKLSSRAYVMHTRKIRLPLLITLTSFSTIYLFFKNEMPLLCAPFCTARKQVKRLIVHFSYLKINLGRMFNSLTPKGKTAKLRNLKKKKCVKNTAIKLTTDVQICWKTINTLKRKQRYSPF